MLKITVILLGLCIAASECGSNKEAVETINFLDADGNFHFKSSQDGNLIEIRGFIETENGESFLRMNGTYIFEDYAVRFTVKRDEYKLEPFDRNE